MRYWMEDVTYKALGVFFALFVGCITVAVFALAVDSVYAVKAERAVVACEAKRMEGRRLSFSASVTCVPAARGTKNDTLTINGVTP